MNIVYFENLSSQGILLWFIQPYVNAMPNQDVAYIFAFLWGFTMLIAMLKAQTMIIPVLLLFMSGAFVLNGEWITRVQSLQVFLMFIFILAVALAVYTTWRK